jgi:1-deoxy-D-xylulose-5-phosphate synthase
VVVILNDNEMSIAPNVGAMSRYLTQVQRNPLYNRVRDKIGEFVETHDALNTLVRKWEESVKSFLTPGVLFEELGFRYFGPLDGHDLDVLIDTLEVVRDRGGPRLVHVVTQKGRGFPAGEHVEKWHALPPGHDPATGKQRTAASGNPNYTAVFGAGLSALMDERGDVVAITAAMPSGTGTGGVATAHPSRFFDVGIAEGHAVTFAAGMATRGLRPVVAIYSTFLQRAYDNLIHDVALQSLPVVFCMDRAGLVGEDGETHMGLYDIAYMLAVPNMTVTAPKDGTEMLALVRAGVEHEGGPFCLRYPRDVAPDLVPPMRDIAPTPHATWEVLRTGHDDIAILAVGTMVAPALAAAATLGEEGLDVTVVNCRYLKPHDDVTLAAILGGHKSLLVVEEGTVVNGFGAYLARIVEQQEPGVRVVAHGVPDRIIVSASRRRQLSLCGLDAAGIADRVRALRDRGDRRVIRIGVVGHRGYDAETLCRLSPTLGVALVEPELAALAPNSRCCDLAGIDACSRSGRRHARARRACWAVARCRSWASTLGASASSRRAGPTTRRRRCDGLSRATTSPTRAWPSKPS